MTTVSFRHLVIGSFRRLPTFRSGVSSKSRSNAASAGWCAAQSAPGVRADSPRPPRNHFR